MNDIYVSFQHLIILKTFKLSRTYPKLNDHWTTSKIQPTLKFHNFCLHVTLSDQILRWIKNKNLQFPYPYPWWRDWVKGRMLMEWGTYQGGRGHLAVSGKSPQSFIKMFSYSLAYKLGDFYCILIG